MILEKESEQSNGTDGHPELLREESTSVEVDSVTVDASTINTTAVNTKSKAEQKKIALLLDFESNEKLESVRDLLNARSKKKWQLQDVASEILQMALKSEFPQDLIDENTTMEWRVEEALSDPQRRDAVMKALGLTEKNEKSEKLNTKKSRRSKETSEKDFIENESGTSN